MKVLMISLDRGMFGGGFSGDVVERHQKYADLAGSLDVLVFASEKFQNRQWKKNFRVFSTRSSRTTHYKKAFEVFKNLQTQNFYDLIVTQDFAAPVGKKIKQKYGLPWIVTIHGMFFSGRWIGFNPIKWLLLREIKKSLYLADGFKANNQTTKEKLFTWGIKNPVLIQPTPANIEGFKTEEKPHNEILKILFVGRLSREKNLAMLIRVARKIQLPFDLTIVGEGDERKKLENLSKGAKNIKFVGGKRLPELAEYFKQADIFVLPSDTESYGVVLLQAAAAGCAIIATKTAGAMNLIKNDRGILIDVGDEIKLEDSLERLITDKNLRNNLAVNARQMIKNYDSEEGVEKVVEFWKKIINK
ncbi:MAG: hypothetical protein COT91_00445 [Candidatus Doudnabacteria bacterium CG10_big_fil_rev_8_21_14_0_10_41_10]|uniref:Glycosyl transferase family 1 domain-containing protein n=1 Tax=Candidatus Doudnabacteria bacterium CG10_big_fil_rev_8_21_14_0_10_41_10 TaxID=1974551 RepID=A0A2H0VES3_9BACT|nr:MAG: hypothetical protein COT91_00445 [Candidatus Doudnabacteria bacterium CG10_big_fil_rev_8_21_14_0_10_41_10]